LSWSESDPVSFWRKEVIDFALDDETRRASEEQLAWIAREPGNPRPYYNLAQLCRMRWKRESGLALLLEAVRLDESFAEAHVALTEVYTMLEDYRAAWRHARAAERQGDRRAVELLERHNIDES
jgi:hypothetical protein